MYCVQCGNQVREGAKFCDACGAQVKPPKAAPANDYVPRQVVTPVQQRPVTAPQPMPQVVYPVQPVQAPAKSKYKSLLTVAIITLVAGYLMQNLVAVVLGIIAVIYAARAKKQEKLGAELEARAAAKTAKALNITNIILEIVWLISIVILAIVLLTQGLKMVNTLAGNSPEELQSFLQKYGYDYDIELIREFLQQRASLLLL